MIFKPRRQGLLALLLVLGLVMAACASEGGDTSTTAGGGTDTTGGSTDTTEGWRRGAGRRRRLAGVGLA